jgi:glycosyltransferase 2 family protein
LGPRLAKPPTPPSTIAPLGDDLGKGSGRSRWRSLAPWVSGLLSLAAVVLVVLHFGTLEQFTRLALSIRPGWLFLALSAQAATYLCASLAWRQTLRRAGHPRSLRILVPLGIAKLFTDQVVPSNGVSGAILVTAALTRRGVPIHAALAVLLVGLVSYFGAYLLAVVGALGVLWLHHRANAALFIVTAVFIVVIVAIPSGVFLMKGWGRRLPAAWIKHLPGTGHFLKAIAEAPTDLVRDPVLLVQTVTLEFAVFAFDALTLWLVLQGLGEGPAIWVAFASFMTASVATTLGPIPLGLGTFEAACVAMLTLLGVAVEAALTATLLLRGLTLWLPMIPGLWLARHEVNYS